MIGGPGCCTGLGLKPLGGSVMEAAVEARRLLAPQRAQRRIASRVRAARSANGMPTASNSSASQPTPTPNRKRPLDSTSSEAAALATATALRSGRTKTPVPSLMRLVQRGDVRQRDEGIVQRHRRAAGELAVGRVRIRVRISQRDGQVLGDPHRLEAQRLGLARHLGEHLRPRRRAAAHRMQCELHGGRYTRCAAALARGLSRPCVPVNAITAAKNAKGAKQRRLATLASLAANQR